MICIKFIIYPLGMFVLWQIIFIITQLSLTYLNTPQVIVAILSLIINCGMQILIGYKIPQLAPKYKFVASATYIILFTFLLAIYSTTILLEGLKVAPQAIWLGYLFFHVVGMALYFANNTDEFCWENLLK
ncbi:hypothetical protein BFR69_06105 [Acinetobacter pittii]|jgi:hypothetical protein|uniref:hypothetical protein n=1 Tax=Acinetobacter TaxID=469 RepID=UPI00046DF70F|nr:MULTISPECIES: hypothetical protein [Acinetobacter]MBS6928854.1 hypothetical protein [Finegoldia magna]OIF82007.1 hypothetical protein A7N09_38070 [Acinetobacter baumannii]AZB98660.1 hypothetical protein DKE45_009675 [Acinetobacter pittii]KAI0678788.1 hypothetical protein A6010_14695 [Acinetobacter pittii]KQD29048.1 hypothetical protein APD13_15575 [Acinetobacter pittii]